MSSPHKLAEHSMESFWSYYEKGALTESIGLLQSFGHADEAVDFALKPDSYYFPNMRGDELRRPASISDDRIPVVALENGRTYRFERPSLHYLQRIALARCDVPNHTIIAASQAFTGAKDSISTSGEPQGTASLFARLHQLDKTDRYIESKPTIIFNVDITATETDDLTSVALHEITHVVQTLSRPLYVDRPEHHLERELQAYGVQARLVHNAHVPYNMSTAAAHEIDIFRKQHLGHNNFSPTPEFIRYSMHHALFARILGGVA